MVLNFRNYANDIPVPLDIFAGRDVVDVGVEYIEVKRQETLARKALLEGLEAKKKEEVKKEGEKEEDTKEVVKISKEAEADEVDEADGESDTGSEQTEEEEGDEEGDAKPSVAQNATDNKESQKDAHVEDAQHNKSKDIHTVPGEKENKEPDSTTHTCSPCKSCGMSPIKGPRFKCLE